MADPKHTNQLVHERSPYLLQHAHNPVEWHAWNEATLHKARSLDKMLLISIGYSACHWCHVMEHESFSDEKVANLMNEHFICVKVDREERPDVDQVYMDAVQMITGSGGWPLNCFALPDGRPFFGGTYFRKDQWTQLLENISLLYTARRKELESQAEALTSGVRDLNLFKENKKKTEFTPEKISEFHGKLFQKLDEADGGMKGSPKFPMPSVHMFLLDQLQYEHNEAASYYLNNTLIKMAFGGIYDQLGGGFARYSTDHKWKIPHFEKMLYDNAQLVSLYSRAYKQFGSPVYKEVVFQTLEFIKREMTHPEGGFYSALDADSEGEEGRYYLWTEKEIRQVLGSQADLYIKYYRVGKEGLWNNGDNILIRVSPPDVFAREHGVQPSAFKSILSSSRKKLLKHREKRVRPGLDDKILLSWNAMMIEAYVDAYRVFGKEEFLHKAVTSANFLLASMSDSKGTLFHVWKDRKAYIQGFLEDYAFLISAMLSLYQATFDDRWLKEGIKLTDKSTERFYDNDSGYFNFTPGDGEKLIAEKKEILDNVVPSANAVMARNLFLLGNIMLDRKYYDWSRRMADNAFAMAGKYPSAFTHWARTALSFSQEFSVISVLGKGSKETGKMLYEKCIPGTFVMVAEQQSDWPQLKGKFPEGKIKTYVCSWEKCSLATENVSEVLRKFDLEG